MTKFIKRSPLTALCGARGAQFTQVDGWEVADHFGDPAAEQRALASGSVLVDWSHIGKLRIRGADAAERTARLWPGAADLRPLQTAGDENMAVLRLTHDEFLVLCGAARVDELTSLLGDGTGAVTDSSGAFGALLLGGTRRGEVIERSAAMDLSARSVKPGSVVQTTLHTVPCTVYRSADWDLYLQTRDYTESLYAAFMDVGSGVGLTAAGIACVPTNLGAGVDHG